MSRFPRRSDGTAVTNTYHATGERQRTSGSRTYPVECTYDHAGRMKTMKTWRNFASDTGAALTTWNYSAQRGFLLSKQYADASYWIYQYATLGQVISGKCFWPAFCQPQRGCGLQPRVARHELPWVSRQRFPQPQRGYGLPHRSLAATPLGLRHHHRQTQGSCATLGWRPESRWDSGNRSTHADASYWIYQYDSLGQVTSGKRFWPDGTPVAGQQFEYGFDDIGNRQSAAHGGSATQSHVAPVILSSVRNGGEGRGEEALRHGENVCTGGAPLSPALAPFVHHEVRETDALLGTAVPA